MVPLFPSMSVSKSTGPRIVESEGVGGEMSGGVRVQHHSEIVKMARVKFEEGPQGQGSNGRTPDLLLQWQGARGS